MLTLYQSSVDWRQFSEDYNLKYKNISEHERDALIAAICAREGFSGNWRDLAEIERSSLEQDPRNHWIGPVSYFWPKL